MYRGQTQHQTKQFYVMQIYSKKAQQEASASLEPREGEEIASG